MSFAIIWRSTLKVPRGAPPLSAAFLLQIFRNPHAMQRPKKCASCGDDTALKARSHPTGIFACAGGGDRNPSSCGKTAGLIDRKRSPFSARFTDGDSGVEIPWGNEGNEMKLAANSASATPAARAQNKLRIGLTPRLACVIPKPLMACAKKFPARDLQRDRPDGGSLWPRFWPNRILTLT